MMKNPPTLSVILPVYNGAKTLTKTLESLRDQTFQDFELICCIDGTHDGSEDIMREFQNDFQSLIILRNPNNLGLGATMNKLMAHTKGAYVAVAEQDDIYPAKRFEWQLEVFEKMPDVGMVSGMSEFWNGKKVTFIFPGILASGKQYPEGKEMFLLNYRNKVKVVNSCMMIRKQVHTENGLYFTKHYPSVSVDWTYVLRFSLVSKIYGIPKVLVRLDRRVERDSLTTHKEKLFKASRELIRSFRYEYPELIAKKDYQYALRTQINMEMNHLPMIPYLFSFLCNVLKCPFEKRYYQSFLKRCQSKLGR